MIEYRFRLIHKFLPRRNFPMLRRSSLQRIFSFKVDYHWTIKTCGKGLLCEYLLQVYFGIHLQMKSWFLIHLLWWKDRILVYQIWWWRSQFYFLMHWIILHRLLSFSIYLRLDVVPLFCWFFSSFCLLTFPSSLFEGLIRRHGNFELKFSLWSLSVMKEGFLARCSILSLSSSFFGNVPGFHVNWLFYKIWRFFVSLRYVVLQEFFVMLRC